MEKTNKAIMKCLDYIIGIVELGEIQQLKHNAVKEQRFEDAIKLREQEREVQSRQLTLTEIKELRASIA